MIQNELAKARPTNVSTLYIIIISEIGSDLVAGPNITEMIGLLSGLPICYGESRYCKRGPIISAPI